MLLVLTMQTRISGKYRGLIRKGHFGDFLNRLRGHDLKMVHLDIYGTPSPKEVNYLVEIEKFLHLTLQWEPNPQYTVVYH